MENHVSTPMTYNQRVALSRKYRTDKAKGLITDADVEARLLHKANNPEWPGTPLIEAGNGLDFVRALDYALSNNWRINSGDALTTKSSDVLTSATTAVVRTDLEPEFTDLFVKEFPAFDLLPKELANGITHTYVVRTAFNDTSSAASFVGETTAANFGTAAYGRNSSTCAIGITERGASLYQSLGVAQSGMNYGFGGGIVDAELQTGAWNMAYLFQKAFYQGNATDAAGTLSNESGAYNALGFTGLRGILSGAAAFSSYLNGQTPPARDQGADTLQAAINKAARAIMNNGGRPTHLHVSANAAEALAKEGVNFMRIDNRDAGGVTLGMQVDAINTIAGRLPLVIVPGDSIGQYTAPSTSTYSGNTVEDMYLVDHKTTNFASLGSLMPSVIQIPMGVDGKLFNRYLLFWMATAVIHAPVFNAKVRIPYNA